MLNPKMKSLLKKILQPITSLSILLISLQVSAVNINFGPNGCTLQDAIRSANTDSAVGNCSSGSGTDFLIAPDVWIKTLNTVLPTITSDMTIRTATASGLLEINGDGHRIFRVTGNSTNLTLQRVYLHHGGATSAINAGGAVRIVDASVTIQDSFLYDNSSYVGKGGAIFIKDGELNIENTVFFGNGAYGAGSGVDPIGGGDFDDTYGGAVYAQDSTLDIDQSNFLENRSQFGFNVQSLTYLYRGRAASIFMDGGELSINASLFSENYSGILAQGVVATISNSTFFRKIPQSFFDFELVDFRGFSSLILNHVTMNTPARVQDSILNMTNSILRGECRFFNADWIVDAGNIYNTNISVCVGNLFDSPRLLDLSDNGGPTFTFGLHHLSDAIDAGDPSYCLATDQRGEARGALCDIGAFEVTGIADVEVSGTFMQNAPYVSAQNILYNLKIKNNGPALATAVEVDIDTSSIFVTQIDSILCSNFPCVIPSIQPGQEIIIPLTMTVGNHINSPFNISASVSTTANSLYTDFDLNNNMTTLSQPINQGADMGVVMNLLTAEPYFIGQSITYEATINNYGQQTASAIELEFMPTGLNNIVFQNCNSSVGQVCSYQNLLNGGSGIITINADITMTQFDGVAEVSSGMIDVNNSNNIDDIQNNGAVTETDIGIVVDINQSAPYYAYQYLEFTVEITNGDKAVSNVHVYSDFPDAEYIGAIGCGFPCIIPFMAANSVQTITLQYFAPTEVIAMNQIFSHYILVTPAQTDPDMSNNEITVQKSLFAAADVAANLILTTLGPYFVGQSVQYNLRVANSGVSHATDLDIVLIPESLTLLWAVSDNCITVDCTLANFDRFLIEDITLVYTIDEPGAFDLTATVNANEIDIFPNNNLDDSGNGGTATSIQSELMFLDGFE